VAATVARLVYLSRQLRSTRVEHPGSSVWRGENLAPQVPLKAADGNGKGSMSHRA
jgi:hypothetical protein